MKVIINKVEEKPEVLLFTYPNQILPQPAYIEVDLRGDEIELSADYSGEIGNSISSNVFNKLRFRYKIPAHLHGEEINEIMGDERLHKMLGEMAGEYDYDSQRGRLTEKGEAIDREINYFFSNL